MARNVSEYMENLLTCPKCGDISLYVSNRDFYSGYESRGYRVSCKCHFAWDTISWCKTEEETINKWNNEIKNMQRSSPVISTESTEIS